MLTFTVSGSNLQIGNSYSIKDHLKNNLKAKWNPEARAWEVPTHLDCDHLRKELKDMVKAEREKKKEAELQQRIRDATPEGRAAIKEAHKLRMRACLEEDKKRVARGEAAVYWFVCCEDCEIISSRRGRHMTSCNTCADLTTYPWPLTTKINGVWYTGD